MAGIDRHTFGVIATLDSAYQGLEVMFTTRLASRVMRREFGGGIVEMLGRRITPPLFSIFQQLVATAIDLWEPRFKVRRIVLAGSAEEVRLGILGIQIEVDYRPRGHLGDETVERVVNFAMTFSKTGVKVLA